MLLDILHIGFREIQQQAQNDIHRKCALGFHQEDQPSAHLNAQVVIQPCSQHILQRDHFAVSFRDSRILRVQRKVKLSCIHGLLEQIGKYAVLCGTLHFRHGIPSFCLLL